MAKSNTARERLREREAEPEPQFFTMPLLGALYGSVVVVAVIFVMNTSLGRNVEDDLDAPARTLIAGPLIAMAIVVFLASMVALIVPAYRRESMRVAEFAAWIIPAWAVMAGLVLGGISYALSRLG